MPSLGTLAKTIRSKNAGVDKVTFDIIFRDEADYRRVTDSGALTKEAFARLYNIDTDRVTDYVLFDPAFAIKITILRDLPSGSPGDADVFGAQQYGPLLGVEIPG